jgi:hypothetical protein
VQHARELGYYSNLITSGYGLTEERIIELKEAGLDHRGGVMLVLLDPAIIKCHV